MGGVAGRVAIVTGASRGIGAGIAQRLAAEGAAVALTARTLEPKPGLPGTLRETEAAIARLGGRCVSIQADLADPASRARIVSEAEARLGPVDILVNNAARAFYEPCAAISDKRLRPGKTAGRSASDRMRTPEKLALTSCCGMPRDNGA